MVLLLIFACKREVQIDIEDKPSQLVVNAVLDVDSLMLFNLSQTQNITNNKPVSFIENGSVEVLDEDTVQLAFLLHTNKGNYSSIIRPVAGKQYYFRITTPGRTYWVSERMPDSARCMVYDTSRIIFQGRENFFQIRVRLQDDFFKSNYYGIRVKRIFKAFNGTDTIMSEEWVSLESIDFVLTENPKSKFSKKNLLFTDEYFNGQTRILTIGGNNLFSNPSQKTLRLEVYTTAYSRNGYNYYTSVNEHLFYQNDPFSQPTLLQGNIPGAFGAAIGSISRKEIISFKP
jgi:hypothetical protein